MKDKPGRELDMSLLADPQVESRAPEEAGP